MQNIGTGKPIMHLCSLSINFCLRQLIIHAHVAVGDIGTTSDLYVCLHLLRLQYRMVMTE